MHRLFCPLPSHHFRFCLIIVLPLSSLVLIGESDNNQSLKGFDVIRVLKPGIFELKTEDYLVRMRTWGVGFPVRTNPVMNRHSVFLKNGYLTTRFTQ